MLYVDLQTGHLGSKPQGANSSKPHRFLWFNLIHESGIPKLYKRLKGNTKVTIMISPLKKKWEKEKKRKKERKKLGMQS